MDLSLLEFGLEGVEKKGNVENHLFLFGLTIRKRLGLKQGGNLDMVLSELKGGSDGILRVALVKAVVIDKLAIPLVAESKEGLSITETILEALDLRNTVIGDLLIHPLEETILKRGVLVHTGLAEVTKENPAETKNHLDLTINQV